MSGPQYVPSPNGVNHLAISTSNIKETLIFFNEVLDFPLQALYWMHGVKNTAHGFLAVNSTSLIAFVYNPNVNPNIQQGKTHPSNIDGASVTGTMHHLSFSVDSINDLKKVQTKVRQKNITCSDVREKDDLHSIHFSGTQGIVLQVSYRAPIKENKSAIDLSAALAIGLEEDEIKNLTTLEPFPKPVKDVPNPAYGEDLGYRMNYPLPLYKAIMSASDQTIYNASLDDIPPTEKNSFRIKIPLAKLSILGRVIYHALFTSWRKA